MQAMVYLVQLNSIHRC